MIARDLISVRLPALELSDPIQKVVERMSEFRVSHMPVVEDELFLGSVTDVQLFEFPDYSRTLQDLQVPLNAVHVYANQHIYEVIQCFADSRMSLVPVLGEENIFLGVISQRTIVEQMAGITAMKENGAILIIEMTNSNNSLSHIAQIVESVNLRILSSYITSYPDSTRTELTLKVNTIDVSSLISNLLRYDYNIISVFNEKREDTLSSDRFDQLMNYLSI